MGNPSAQPEQKFAFPDPATGADDQTFRLIVRPDVRGARARLRFSNFFGTPKKKFGKSLDRPLAKDRLSRKRAADSQRNRKLLFEGLEDRRVLAGVPTVVAALTSNAIYLGSSGGVNYWSDSTANGTELVRQNGATFTAIDINTGAGSSSPAKVLADSTRRYVLSGSVFVIVI